MPKIQRCRDVLEREASVRNRIIYIPNQDKNIGLAEQYQYDSIGKRK